MRERFDATMLSAYVDGELDADAMRKAEQLIEKDQEARRFVLNAIKSTAFLRAGMNKVLHEEVPERLLAVFDSKETPKTRPGTFFQPFFRMAAALVLVLLGFGAGTLLKLGDKNPLPALIYPWPAEYSRVVNEALESNVSGISREWQSAQTPVSIKVTPIKTYRYRDGRYYRKYRMEATTAKECTKMNCLAVRVGQQHWQTIALFFTPESLDLSNDTLKDMT